MKTFIRTVLKTREYVLTFGRYKGRTVEEMLEEDPDYLIWAHENIEWFKLEPDIMDEAIENALNHPTDEELPWWVMLEDDPPY